MKSHVEVPNSPSLNLTGVITIDLHVKTYGSTGTWQGIIAKRDDGNPQEKVQFQLALNDNLQLFYCLCVGGPDHWWFPPTEIRLEPNRWYHVVTNYDAFRRRVIIWVDGVLRKTFTGVPIIRPSNNPVYLGWSGWHNEFFNGEIRQVRIVDALAEKIADLKNEGVDHCVLVDANYLPHRFALGQDVLSGILEANLLNPRDTRSRVTLDLKIGNKTIQGGQDLPGRAFGRISCVVPESLTRMQARIELTEDGKTIGQEVIPIPGNKEVLGYRGYVVSHTHSDLCWPDTPEVCMNANVAAIAKSVEIAGKMANYRFTMEHVLFLREYLRRHPEKTDLVRKLMQAGVIETGAFYTGPWELTCGGEGLVRQLYLGKLWVKKNLGVDPVTVWNVDVAGHTAQMPQILHKAGIRGLVISAGATDNTPQQPYLLHETRGPFLFRWQAPDGSSVPTWSTPWGYGSGGALGLRKESLEEMSRTFPGFLEDVRKNHAAHGLPRIAFVTDGTDIQSPSPQVGENIQKWNTTNHFPPMTYASTAELFAAVAKEPLPTYAGEMPSPWDSVQSQGNECFLLDRRLEGRLLAAEKLASLASLLVPGFIYPHDTFTKIWENRLFAVEHNWGGAKGEISNRQKTAKIAEANEINDGVLRSTLEALAGAVRPAKASTVPILVFNPLSWDRREVVACTLPISREKVGHLTIVDSANKAIPHQIVAQEHNAREDMIRVIFCAEAPSLGYATYYVVHGLPTPTVTSPFQIDSAQNTFENGFYRIKLDPSTGGIQSIFDKRTQKELVRQGGKYHCNELVVFEDDDADIGLHLTGKQWRMQEHSSTIRVVENGPVRLVIEVAGGLLEHSARRQEIILYRDLPRIDLVTTVDWEGKRNIHLYQAFPLNVPDQRVRYAVPYGWQEFGKEMKYAAPWPFGPVAGYRWRGVRGWIELTNEATSVTLASECNYAAFKDLAAQPEAGYLIQPLLLRTVRSCGNGNLYYEQRGKHQFRFSLQSQADSARLGAELDSPLLSHVMKPASTSARLPDRLSLARVQPRNVHVAVVKKAEDNRGLVFRLVEVKGSKEQSRAEIRLFQPMNDAVKTTIIEEDEAGLSPQNGVLVVPVAPFGIETVRVSF